MSVQVIWIARTIRVWKTLIVFELIGKCFTKLFIDCHYFCQKSIGQENILQLIATDCNLVLEQMYFI